MPLKVPNYGEWEGDRRGYHPPACTCYSCNEAKGREQGNQPQAGVGPAEEAVSQAEAVVRQAASAPAYSAPARTAASKTAGTQTARRPFRAARLIVGAALRYAIVIHAVTIAGLVVYAIVQGGTDGVAPALSTAWDAYAGAWASAIQAVGG